VVKLKMPGIYESVVFAERTVGHEAWQGLPNVPERIPIRWIVPDRSDADEFGPPGATAERCWVRPKNASNIKIAGAGHLVSLPILSSVSEHPIDNSSQIAQERPVEVGEDLRDFVLEVYSDLHCSAKVRANL
jgi:hypothetical protein